MAQPNLPVSRHIDPHGVDALPRLGTVADPSMESRRGVDRRCASNLPTSLSACYITLENASNTESAIYEHPPTVRSLTGLTDQETSQCAAACRFHQVSVSA